MNTPSYNIRQATSADLTHIMPVIDAARYFMAHTGNHNQWTNGYPSRYNILADIDKGGGYVAETPCQDPTRDDGGKTHTEREKTTHNNTSAIVGYFAFLPSPEPTYDTIYNGRWLDDTLPYHVIHRIASLPCCHGIFNAIIQFCATHEPNLRIDTHRDNIIMQHCILSHGFTYCGIIHLASGSERLAYQRLQQ